MFFPLNYSLCCRCSHSARLFVLVLLFSVSSLSGACSTETDNTEREDVPRERAVPKLQPDTMAARRPSAAVSILDNPFVADQKQSRKLDAYFARINADFTLDAEGIENIHSAEVTDTIYTIRFGESAIEFYAPTQTGDLLLQMADIRNSGVTLRNNMRVGMSQAEVMAKLKNFDVRILQTPSEIVATSREGAPSSLRFYLKSGKVNRILYEGYVD
ncbi:hypothetical protein [Pontibacter ruber]|uniref:DUF4251 domain-containing protein n=1 Tax=Pontibacter ruber TaxID=1343895 RepID=A0ABW5D1J8_9BACT|nr:hypothetical protein [Pontibacter ruber]